MKTTLIHALSHARLAMLSFLLMCASMLAQAQIWPDGARPTSPADATSVKGEGQRQVSPGASAAPTAPAATASEPAGTWNPSKLPTNPLESATPVVFGSQIFSGRFGGQGFSGFNPDYQIAVGDRIHIRMWGAFTYEATQAVDPLGNVFVPNVGPIRVLGLRNEDLNRQVELQVRRVFQANVGLYATLESAQPVKIYVTGFVRAPGLYGGLSSDSVLAYLDRAGGIDPDRGSYLEVDVLRSGKSRAKINLYRFLLDGQIEQLQLQDGDTIVAYPRKHTVLVKGDVLNPYLFEFLQPSVEASEIVAVARPRPSATHLAIARKVGAQTRSEYHPLGSLGGITIADGDEVTFTSDKYPGTIFVRVEGAHQGERSLVLPYGAKLRDAMDRIRPAAQADMAAMQLFRRSVAVRQKEMLDTSLRGLETYALTARSATSEEAALRTREADLILQFVQRARATETRGRVLLEPGQQAAETLLEDGDVIRVPERSNLVLVNGEVLVPNALVWDPKATVQDYIRRSGGYTQPDQKARVIVVKADGNVSEMPRGPLSPGDEVMVLPKIETKSVEITRGITQIIYQLAVAAKVVLDL